MHQQRTVLCIRILIGALMILRAPKIHYLILHASKFAQRVSVIPQMPRRQLVLILFRLKLSQYYQFLIECDKRVIINTAVSPICAF